MNGAAVGAGMNLALVCDVRLAAARAASGPRELVRRIKDTLKDVATIDEHAAAVDRELVPQVWSLAQPAFRERVAALQAKITSK